MKKTDVYNRNKNAKILYFHVNTKNNIKELSREEFANKIMSDLERKGSCHQVECVHSSKNIAYMFTKAGYLENEDDIYDYTEITNGFLCDNNFFEDRIEKIFS